MKVDLTRLERDEEGYLFDPEDWTDEVALELASEESLSLQPEHWTLLRFIRDYHAKHGITPDIRHAVSFLVELTGCDKKQAKARIFELFPYGYVRQSCKIAGMKRPRAWSTG